MTEPDPLNSERQKEIRANLETKLLERHKSDFRKVMSFVEGRRVIWRLLKECGVPERDAFDQNALMMARLAGERRIGIFILKRITPEEELKMKAEARSDVLNRENELKLAEAEQSD